MNFGYNNYFQGPNSNPYGGGLFNPYANYQQQVNQTSPILPGSDTLPKPQPVIIPQNNYLGRIILSDTHLPRSYYDDIIDNLELVTLNIVNDIKTLIKNQRKMKVNKFQSNILTNMKSSIKEQFYEVEHFREKEKLKIIDEFKNSKTDIGNFLKEKFKPIQDILEKFRDDLKADKREISSKMGQIESALYNENEDVKKLLTNSKDPFIKYAAEKEYRIIMKKIISKFRIGRNGLPIPYIEVGIPLNCLQKIIIGPCLESSEAITRIKKFLLTKGVDIEHIDIITSQIPYRNRI